MTNRHTTLAPATNPATLDPRGGIVRARVLYVTTGVLLGIVFVKSEVLSWYRIQEMFRFHSADSVEASALAPT